MSVKHIFLVGALGCAFSWWRLPQIEVPTYFPPTVFALPTEAIDFQRAELGRALFYDPILSLDSTISCASCHSPYHAFAHVDHALSHGIGDSIGTRNAPALFNLAWAKSLMWDGAINHLDMQSVAPITHADEMGETMTHVVQKLKRSTIYQEALSTCWPNEEWETFHVLRALSLFQATLISQSTRYDQMRKGQVTFTAMEEKGYTVFQTQCNQCHREPLFTTGELSNNGLPMDSNLRDEGAFARLQTPGSKGLFKIPSLRNWAFTKPYMHDGRFERMADVLNHYRRGTYNHWSSNTHMTAPLPISDQESVELMAFLKTLNDSAFVFDPSHHFPKIFFQQAKERTK
jgi:cytochrome c peroxidase